MGAKEVNYLKWLKDLHSKRILLPNQQDETGLSQIHHCAYRGYLSCLKWLAKHGGNLASSSAEGSVAAHYAAAGGHLDVLQWIYRRSSRTIAYRDHNGATPLYFAAQEGHLDCLEWLTKRSGTVHGQISIDGMTAAHASAQEGHLDCLAFLIQCAGCSGLARDKTGCTPMHFAAAGGHRSCVHWLALHGWGTGNERNKTGSSPLHVAAEHGHMEVVKLLMKSGAKADLYDRHGRTAYDIAVETGNEACAQFLLQATHKTLNGMVANIFVHQSSLKRVRFERKAIEKGIRDSNPELTESQTLEAVNQLYYPHLDQSQDRMFRSRSLVYPSYSSYRESRALAENRTYSTNCLNKGVSLTNYLSNFDSSLTPVLESRPRNGYVTHPSPAKGSFHQPLQRSYSEPIQPTPDLITDNDKSPKNGMLGTQSVRNEVLLSDWSSPKRNSFKISNPSNQYEVNGYSNVSCSRPSVSSILSAFRSKSSKSKENPNPEAYNPKDLLPFPVESGELNVFRRLYRLSKKKLTRTTSLSISDRDRVPNKPKTPQDRFLVTGEDPFIPGSPRHSFYEPTTTELSPDYEDQWTGANGHVAGMSTDEETGDNMQIVSYHRPTSSGFTIENIRTKMRDNALIW
ncbi:ankyrin repeat and KH domain-containing protein 1-like [Actinia tenebrosa]|uniref:Ankyrin repeat and KH domain-containing protein 1-like n=1 Tax=Actinia tenebrosa TaxID=6105 RepID=A0A6P8I4R4_ACTTE|nr:ankyrin repeat and KH domain-containing protein 1-like [Actinia tenebrosa]